MKKLNNVGELAELRKKLEQETFKKDALRLRACCGTACTATGAYKVIDAFEKEAEEKGLDVEVDHSGIFSPVCFVEKTKIAKSGIIDQDFHIDKFFL